MPAIERVIPLVGHLPAAIRDALARRLRELIGLGLLSFVGCAAAALMSWSVQDPSLSHATSRPIRNLLGYPGAIGADLLMQILGLGAIMLILPIAVWGWRMITHRAFDRHALRFGCWILSTILAAGFASCWPHGGKWPLPTGLGGVIGDALVRAPAVALGPPGLVYHLTLCIVLGAATVAAFLFAAGVAKDGCKNTNTTFRGNQFVVQGGVLLVGVLDTARQYGIYFTGNTYSVGVNPFAIRWGKRTTAT